MTLNLGIPEFIYPVIVGGFVGVVFGTMGSLNDKGWRGHLFALAFGCTTLGGIALPGLVAINELTSWPMTKSGHSGIILILGVLGAGSSLILGTPVALATGHFIKWTRVRRRKIKNAKQIETSR